MNMTLKPAFGLSGSALKVIAMISMVIDHIALYLMEYGTVLYETMRCIGRIAFPVFAFLIAEGFIHTRSRYRYFFTLLGFAVISEIPWYLLNGVDGTHNVMFTLALGVATLMVLENLLQRSMVLGFLCKSGKTKSDTYQKRKAIFGAKTKSDENNKGDTRNSIAFIITLMMGYTFKSNFTFSSPANNCCVFPILFS